MKKNGMTLPEIMITVAIIGIISAMLIPLANKAKPDEIKVGFLKNYNELSRAVKELVRNSRVYPICQTINPNTENAQTLCFEGFPFLNNEGLSNPSINSGNRKFCELLAFQYDVDATCSVNAPGAAGTARGASGSFAESFTAKTGEDYRILTNRTLSAEGGSFISEILIDVNGDGNGSDCMYDAASCEHPDTFRLWITADGSISPGDAASDFYLTTRSNVKEKTIVPTGNSFDRPSIEVSADNIQASAGNGSSGNSGSGSSSEGSNGSGSSSESSNGSGSGPTGDTGSTGSTGSGSTGDTGSTVGTGCGGPKGRDQFMEDKSMAVND